MNKIIYTTLILLNGFALFPQHSSQKANFNPDCTSDFWTITFDGYIQQWALSAGIINGGDTVLSGGGISLSYCGDSSSPTFYTDNWNQGQIGINYFDPDSGWVNIPTIYHVQDNGGHLKEQYYTVVGGVIQYVNYWNGTNLQVIDSLPGEFFAGIFDIAVDTSGQAWIFTASSPGTAIDSLKVYNQSGKINSYSFPYDVYGYGSFFLNGTLYIGTNQDSIFPVLINGSAAQLGIGIPFPASSFTDMASCQSSSITISLEDHPKRKIEIFPNPTTGLLNLPLDISKTQFVVYNSLGQSIDIKLDGNILDLTEQPSGLYYLQFISSDRQNYHVILKN